MRTHTLALSPLILSLFAGTDRVEAQDRLALKGSEVRLVDDVWYHFGEGHKGDPILPERLIFRLQGDADLTKTLLAQLIGTAGVELEVTALLGGYHVLRIDTAVRDPFTVAADLSAHRLVDYVSFDGLGQALDAASTPPSPLRNDLAMTGGHAEASTQANPCTSGFIPNDTYWGSGGIGNFGQLNLCEIRMPEAWGITTGEPSVVIGMVDSRTDYEHEDLDGGRWTNPLETLNGVDDGDANLCVDDTDGWDFGNLVSSDGCRGDRNPTILDVSGDTTRQEHGTATAGIALARTNNGKGIAGVAGGDGTAGTGAAYMPVALYFYDTTPQQQPFPALCPNPNDGLCPSAVSMALAIEYAAETGADVISVAAGYLTDYAFVDDAVDFADDEGVLVVAAAGNIRFICSNYNDPQQQNDPACYTNRYVAYPAAYNTDYDAVISVGAALPNDQRWNRGSVGEGTNARVLDVVAPGGNASVTDLQNGTQDFIGPGTIISTDPTGAFGENDPGDYLTATTERFGGTSAAAPHVSGLAALILSLNDSLTPQQVRDIIKDTADTAGCTVFSQFPSPSGTTYAEQCGSGRIDAYAALRYTLTTYGGTPQANLTIPAGETWNFGAVTAAFAPDAQLTVEGELNADGTTFTAADPAQGWRGIFFKPGSDGFVENTVIEQVGGYGQYALSIYDASPSIRESEIRNSLTPGSVTGVRVFGSAADPWLFQNRILGHTHRGIVFNSKARGRMFGENVIYDNASDGFVAGFATDVFFYDENLVETNGVAGIRAFSSGYVTLGEYYYNQYGTAYDFNGYNTIRDNPGGGLMSSNAGDILGAGNSSAAGLNTITNNGTAGNTPPGGWFDGTGPDAKSVGAGSSVVARYNWWGRPANPDTTSYDGAAYTGYVTVDPMLTAPPAASRLSSGTGTSRQPGMLAGRSLDGTEIGIEDEGPHAALVVALDEVGAQRFEAALALLAALAETYPEHPLAAVALNQAAHLETMADSPVADVGSVLDAAAAHPSAQHRMWAQAALVRYHTGRNDTEAALAAADVLAAEGRGDDATLGHTAQFYLLAEAGRLAEAEAALLALEAVAPDEIGAELARAHFAFLSDEQQSGRPLRASASEPTASATSRVNASESVFALGQAYPNPSRSGVTVPVSVGEAGHLRLVAFNVLGREVAVLLDDPVEAGRRAVSFDGAGLPSGTYLVRATFETGKGASHVASRSLTLLR